MIQEDLSLQCPSGINALLDAKEQANVTDWSNITLIDKWKSEFSWSYGSCRDKLYPSTE